MAPLVRWPPVISLSRKGGGEARAPSLPARAADARAAGLGQRRNSRGPPITQER